MSYIGILKGHPEKTCPCQRLLLFRALIYTMLLWIDGSIPALSPGAPFSLIEGIDPAE